MANLTPADVTAGPAARVTPAVRPGESPAAAANPDATPAPAPDAVVLHQAEEKLPTAATVMAAVHGTAGEGASTDPASVANTTAPAGNPPSASEAATTAPAENPPSASEAATTAPAEKPPAPAASPEPNYPKPGEWTEADIAAAYGMYSYSATPSEPTTHTVPPRTERTARTPEYRHTNYTYTPAPVVHHPYVKPNIAILIEPPSKEALKEADNGDPVEKDDWRTKKYAEAVRDGGGVVKWVWDDGREPVELLKDVQGVVVPGGKDVNPATYGQEPQEGIKFDCAPMPFDVWEVSMIQKAMDLRLPMRGICRGMQLINVAARGTLVQDLVAHMNRPYPYHIDHTSGTHSIVINPQSQFGKTVDFQTIKVNSTHHQAIDRLAPGFQSVAVAADGTIEAIERANDPTVMGVQFHPERLQGDKVNDFRRRFFNGLIRDADRVTERNRSTAAASKPVAVSATPSASTPAGGADDTAPRAAETRPIVAPPPERKYSREEAFRDAVDVLKMRGLVIKSHTGEWVVRDNVQRATNAVKGTTFSVYGKDSFDRMSSLEMTPYQLDQMLLSLTARGRDLLDPHTKFAVDTVRYAVTLQSPVQTRGGVAQPPVGNMFTQRLGFFSSRQPIFDIEVLWACREGNLEMHYRSEQGTGISARPKSVKELHDAVRVMHEDMPSRSVVAGLPPKPQGLAL